MDAVPLYGLRAALLSLGASINQIRTVNSNDRHTAYPYDAPGHHRVRFSYGLQKDIAAVTAAVETDWSNGQVEGQINRLKAIKRQMYGRSGFNLLRARVLPYYPPRDTADSHPP